MTGTETVVVTDETTDTQTAFAAGLATATAAQATEQADAATARAEQADAIAGVAATQAAGASETAWNAQTAVEQLAATTAAQFAELREALVVVATPPAAPVVDDLAPEPVSQSSDDSPKDEKDKPATSTESKTETTERGYGSSSWFGKRG